MIKITTKLKITHPNGRKERLVGHNLTTDAALTFVAKRIAGEATDQTFNDPWAIRLVLGSDTLGTQAGVATFAPVGNSVSILAQYTVVAAGSGDWTNIAFNLDVGTVGNILTLATATLADFGTAQTNFAGNTRLDFTWEITTAFSAPNPFDWVTNSLISETLVNNVIVPHDPPITLNSIASIDTANAGNLVISLCRGLINAPSTMTLDWYRIINVLTDDDADYPDPPPAGSPDIEVLGQVEAGIASSAIARAALALTWTFMVLESTEASPRLRDRVGVIRWGGNVAAQMGFVQNPQGSANQRTPITVVGNVRRP